MPRDRTTVGPCPQCASGQVVCTYNHFVNPDKELEIHSWEHKCSGCGVRETRAFRSDEPAEGSEELEPRVCPYCGRRVG